MIIAFPLYLAMAFVILIVGSWVLVAQTNGDAFPFGIIVTVVLGLACAMIVSMSPAKTTSQTIQASVSQMEGHTLIMANGEIIKNTADYNIYIKCQGKSKMDITMYIDWNTFRVPLETNYESNL